MEVNEETKLLITQKLAYKVHEMYKHFGWKDDSQRNWKKAVEIVEMNLKRDPTGSTLEWVVKDEEDSTSTE